MELLTAEFLPYGQQLFFAAIDSDCDLSIYQYDPDRTHYPSDSLRDQR
jgi:hypothetical protein